MSTLLLTLAGSNECKEMVALTDPTHNAYCKKHNYERMVTTLDDYTFGKLKLIRDLLSSGKWEYIVYLDADTLIANQEIDLTSALPSWAWLGTTIHSVPSSITLFHVQVGVMYWRACPESTAFLDRTRQTGLIFSLIGVQ